MASLVQDVWLGWEPRGQGGSAGRFGSEVLDDARRLVREGASRWGTLPLVGGGHGLGGWRALALADTPGVAAAFARPPLAAPALVLEGRERPAAEAEAVGTAAREGVE